MRGNSPYESGTVRVNPYDNRKHRQTRQCEALVRSNFPYARCFQPVQRSFRVAMRAVLQACSRDSRVHPFHNEGIATAFHSCIVGRYDSDLTKIAVYIRGIQRAYHSPCRVSPCGVTRQVLPSSIQHNPFRQVKAMRVPRDVTEHLQSVRRKLRLCYYYGRFSKTTCSPLFPLRRSMRPMVHAGCSSARRRECTSSSLFCGTTRR